MSDSIPRITDDELLPLLTRYFDMSESLRETRALKHLCLRPRKDKDKVAKVNDDMMRLSAEMSDLAARLSPVLHGTPNWKTAMMPPTCPAGRKE